MRPADAGPDLTQSAVTPIAVLEVPNRPGVSFTSEAVMVSMGHPRWLRVAGAGQL